MTTKSKYFEWLCDLAGLNPPQGPTYIGLAHELNHTEFYSLVGNDDDRGKDGKHIRFYFSNTFLFDQHDVIPELDGPCSMLEMVIGLSIRISEWVSGMPFDAERTKEVQLWSKRLLLDNLGLRPYDDQTIIKNGKIGEVRRIIDRVLTREYAPDGQGGLFPVQPAPGRDMRYLEIWKQLSEYLIENPDYFL